MPNKQKFKQLWKSKSLIDKFSTFWRFGVLICLAIPLKPFAGFRSDFDGSVQKNHFLG